MRIYFKMICILLVSPHILIIYLPCFGMDTTLQKIKNYIIYDKNILEVDEYKNTFLHILTDKKYKSDAVIFIPKLIHKGLPVNQRGLHNKTPLYKAVENANATITRVLLQHNADANYTYCLEWAPLHRICSQAQTVNHAIILVIMKNLIEYKANVNLQTIESPLHVACRFSGTQEMIKLLLLADANPSQKTTYKKHGESLYNHLPDNKTALEIAQHYNATEIVELLQNWKK